MLRFPYRLYLKCSAPRVDIIRPELTDMASVQEIDGQLARVQDALAHACRLAKASLTRAHELGEVKQFTPELPPGIHDEFLHIIRSAGDEGLLPAELEARTDWPHVDEQMRIDIVDDLRGLNLIDQHADSLIFAIEFNPATRPELYPH